AGRRRPRSGPPGCGARRDPPRAGRVRHPTTPTRTPGVQAALAGFLRARPDGLAHAGELELPQAGPERVERQHAGTAWVSSVGSRKAPGPRKKAPVSIVARDCTAIGGNTARSPAILHNA